MNVLGNDVIILPDNLRYKTFRFTESYDNNNFFYKDISDFILTNCNIDYIKEEIFNRFSKEYIKNFLDSIEDLKL